MPTRDDPPKPGALVRDTQRDALGAFMGEVGGRWLLRPLGGGREWEAEPSQVEALAAPVPRAVRYRFGDRTHSPGAGPRLLPWSSPEGKPCYLATADEDGYLSRLADGVEATQLRMAEDLLGHAHAMLDEPKLTVPELRFTVARLAEALSDTLRVAHSRGGRST
ncbi:hypothetical protein ACFWIA_14435 [Streptomyces sp. NPDC127068]|uniref:hypothetical protein n=1 Tax=Streptomyces sp. NPDC127068 TaxID=3347127 RepID=UPI0036514369